MMKPEIIISLITAVPVLALGIMNWISASRTNKADVAHKIGSAYDELLENMREEISTLKDDVKFLKHELLKQTNWSARLVKQLVDNGIEPLPPPDTGELKRKILEG